MGLSTCVGKCVEQGERALLRQGSETQENLMMSQPCAFFV